MPVPGYSLAKPGLNISFAALFFLLVILLSASFYHGWYLDDSKPISGTGWADQTLYRSVADKLAGGIPLSKGDFHYQMGYPILGSIALLLGFEDPFAVVSYCLLLLSGLFLLFGALKHFRPVFVALFLTMVFIRLGDVRKLDYAAEVFMLPWNNQFLFFALSVYFYAYSADTNFRHKGAFLIFIGLVTGWTIGTREESAIFLLPLLFIYFLKVSASRIQILTTLVTVFAAYSPNLVIKYHTFGVLFDNVRPTDHGAGYVEKLATYLDFDRFRANFFDVLVNSSHSEGDNAGRLAILQANSWFYLSLIGLPLMLYSPKNKRYILVYLGIVLSLLVFYMAGENMSLQKLRFHCLRYVSPAWIALSFLATYAVSWFFAFFAFGDRIAKSNQVRSTDSSQP